MAKKLVRKALEMLRKLATEETENEEGEEEVGTRHHGALFPSSVVRRTASQTREHQDCLMKCPATSVAGEERQDCLMEYPIKDEAAWPL